MQNFFSPENKIFFRLTQLADLIFLSVLWILCCLTIVLAVPASAAMYHAAYKVIRREHGSLLREFWDNLKKNCKQGIGMTLLLAAAAVLVWFLFTFSGLPELSATVRFFYYCLAWATAVMLVLLLVAVPPLLSRFRMSFGKLLGSALSLSLRHLPTTVLCALIILAAAVGVYYWFFLLLLLPALACLIISFPMERVLSQYMGDPPSDPADPGAWYWSD